MIFRVGNQVAVSRGVKEHAVQCEGAGTLTSVQYTLWGSCSQAVYRLGVGGHKASLNLVS